jgi:hypothetical protein
MEWLEFMLIMVGWTSNKITKTDTMSDTTSGTIFNVCAYVT